MWKKTFFSANQSSTHQHPVDTSTQSATHSVHTSTHECTNTMSSTQTHQHTSPEKLNKNSQPTLEPCNKQKISANGNKPFVTNLRTCNEPRCSEITFEWYAIVGRETLEELCCCVDGCVDALRVQVLMCWCVSVFIILLICWCVDVTGRKKKRFSTRF
jgi:hypothetical protein